MRTKLPNLRALDKINVRLLSLGFLLMCFGVGTGFAFALNKGIAVFVLDSRLLWSSLTLGIYATLLLATAAKGYRGRRVAWFSVLGYATLIISFFSVNFLSGSFHVY